MDNSLTPEDSKLVVLARATRARVGAREGAAVRDQDGRTYAGATVELTALRLSAVQVCVAMAYASGARSLEAAVVLGAAADFAAEDLAALSEFGGSGCVVHLADQAGSLVDSRTL